MTQKNAAVALHYLNDLISDLGFSDENQNEPYTEAELQAAIDELKSIADTPAVDYSRTT